MGEKVLEGKALALHWRRTKIIATLGPATDSPALVEQLLRAGVDVIRLNLSHGSHDHHRRPWPWYGRPPPGWAAMWPSSWTCAGPSCAPGVSNRAPSSLPGAAGYW
jgi:hypothetical protein